MVSRTAYVDFEMGQLLENRKLRALMLRSTAISVSNNEKVKLCRNQ